MVHRGGRTRLGICPKLAVIMVSGGHLLLVICGGVNWRTSTRSGPSLDLSQHAAERGPVQQAAEHGAGAV